MTGDGRTTTAPPAPSGGAVVALFGDRAALAERFATHLATTGVERGLIGPREVPRLWERHVLNCAAVAELLLPGERCVDVGSGAGLPGIALAIARPDVTVTLVEPLQRRVVWLEEVVTDLGLGTVEVVRARAEELHAAGPRFDVATARAVAALDKLAGWCLPLVVPGGRLLALKGRSAAEELEAADGALTRLGARARSIVECGAGILEELTTVVVVEAGEPVSRPGRTGRKARPGGTAARGSGRARPRA
ncbi:MAG: 16S rRNA (guanine(527)-N(7))-methyltransferase RsmG [Actinobacteria bacterium]|nr:16S rRNA (guanine(527)-N(7))-methyltransferase RsmG [Actinomycetota bacterium]